MPPKVSPLLQLSQYFGLRNLLQLQTFPKQFGCVFIVIPCTTAHLPLASSSRNDRLKFATDSEMCC